MAKELITLGSCFATCLMAKELITLLWICLLVSTRLRFCKDVGYSVIINDTLSFFCQFSIRVYQVSLYRHGGVGEERRGEEKRGEEKRREEKRREEKRRGERRREILRLIDAHIPSTRFSLHSVTVE